MIVKILKAVMLAAFFIGQIEIFLVSLGWQQDQAGEKTDIKV